MRLRQLIKGGADSSSHNYMSVWHVKGYAVSVDGGIAHGGI